MTKEMKGVCFLFSETGTEGGWWAMQEDGFADKDGYWSYEGLRFLEEGDDFTVYGDDGRVLFHDIIHKDTKTSAVPLQVVRKGKLVPDKRRKQQVVGGWWVHWIQKSMDPEAWGRLFYGEKRCVMKREENRQAAFSPEAAIAAGTVRPDDLETAMSLSELNGVILSELFGVGTRALFHATDHARTWSRQ